MKKIYFACSIRGGRDDANIYAHLCKVIKKDAELLTEIFADGTLTSAGMTRPSDKIYTTDIAWLQQADAVIAEVTNPSLGVGYEIAKAEERHKPVLALFRQDSGRKFSAMIDGLPYISVSYYQSLAEATQAIEKFIVSIYL